MLDDGTKLRSARDHAKVSTDVRPRIGLTAFNGPWGASVSYARGLTEYTSSQNGSNIGASMRVLRMGLLYRL